MSAQKKDIRSSTQSHLDVEEIKDGLVFLKKNIFALILQTTAINFGLLSEREQEATIFAYASFLNSLTFPIQIIIISRQKDISSYLKLLDRQLSIQKDEKINLHLQDYRRFIENIIQKNKILDKKFYLVLSYFSFGKADKKKALEKAKADLYPKRDHLIGQCQRLGLKTKQLNNKELLKLFYSLYNPVSRGQKFTSPKNYQSVFVQNKQEPGLSQSQNPVSQPAPASPSISRPPEKEKLANVKNRPSQQPLTAWKQEKPLSENQALQQKINQIVKKVAQQGPIKINNNKNQNQKNKPEKIYKSDH